MKSELKGVKTFLLVIFVLSSFTVKPTYAGVMKGWVETVLFAMEKPLINSLSLYESQGFVLIDVGKDFANFSYRAERIPEEKRGKNLQQNNFDLLLALESCASKSENGWLQGKVSTVSVKNKIEESALLIENFLELIQMAQGLWGPANSFVAVAETVYAQWDVAELGHINISLNKEPHQIVFQLKKLCISTNGTEKKNNLPGDTKDLHPLS